VPEPLFESELFGHERGAFTGAGRAKRGLMEAADGGTLFLDEIGDMPPGAQAKLLRALQEKTIRRVGSTEDLPVDVRVIAATNCDLRRAVVEGTFREDLFYRLMVIPIRVPPLRQRLEDIMPLARTFLFEFCRDLDLPVPHLSNRTEEALLAHRWPGNVRELQNWAERTALLGLAATAGRLPSIVEEFPLPAPEATPSGTEERGFGAGDPSEYESTEGVTLSLRSCTLEEAERAVVEQALERAGGNKNKAARALGINRATLYRKLARFRRAGATAPTRGRTRSHAAQCVA
jgi:transcriptional regulator with PAS, ATPase and Fis domain